MKCCAVPSQYAGNVIFQILTGGQKFLCTLTRGCTGLSRRGCCFA